MNATAAKALFDDAVARLDERLLVSRGWVIHSREFPVLDISFRSPARQELRLRLTCDDWNDAPPSVDLLSPDGALLAVRPQLREGSSFFNESLHHRTKRPFVCAPGAREYHDHPSHVNDLWSNYKTLPSFTLGEIVTQLWRGWEKLWP